MSLTLHFLLGEQWLRKNAAPDKLHYQSNRSLFSFSSRSHALVVFSSLFFVSPSFSLPLFLQMGCLADETEESCARVHSGGKEKKLSQAAVRAGLVRGIYKRNKEVKIQYRYMSVCVSACFGNGGLKYLSVELGCGLFNDLFI